jgi:hypothetical protein
MPAKKKAVHRVVHKKSSELYSQAPLSQRPYVTLAILAALTCALALTVTLIQNAQTLEASAKTPIQVVHTQKAK